MAIEVVPHRPEWAAQFVEVRTALRAALHAAPYLSIEHVGSTSVPGLAAKPILDIDVIAEPEDVPAVLHALAEAGYRHRGDLGVAGREALDAPDDSPLRHVYVCAAGTVHVRNHLAVRAVLRARPDLRDEYGAVKLDLAADPRMDIGTYLARKSAVLQRILAESDLSEAERAAILRLNDSS